MNMVTKIRKAGELIRERDKIDKQLAKMFGKLSMNGAKPKRKNSTFVNHGKYLGIVKRLPKSSRVSLGKLYREKGVKAAVVAAQAEVEKRVKA